jgi:predicted site-specific integrase-resolvase
MFSKVFNMHRELQLRTFENCVRVGEAALILGVTTKTLRNWDRSGKVAARRHPVNGYRIYLREELEDLVTTKFKLPAAAIKK